MSEVYEVRRYQVLAGTGWLASLVALVIAVLLNEPRIAWCALFAAVAVLTYHVTADGRATAVSQREAFDIGRRHEQRAEAEQSVRRI